jgi:hypothetical protein
MVPSHFIPSLCVLTFLLTRDDPQADREALVFLIDASPAMLQPAPHTIGGEGGDDPLRKAKSYLDVAVVKTLDP